MNCSWCKGQIENKETQDSSKSHGICFDCAQKLLWRKAQKLNDFVNKFDSPVILIEESGRVVGANSLALEMLGKTSESIFYQNGGDVFECKWAQLPEGCGNTIHCKSCTIRNTVMHTLSTGESCHNVSAYPDLHYLTGTDKVEFIISTILVNDFVVLHIEKP